MSEYLSSPRTDTLILIFSVLSKSGKALVVNIFLSADWLMFMWPCLLKQRWKNLISSKLDGTVVCNFQEVAHLGCSFSFFFLHLLKSTVLHLNDLIGG